MANKIPDHATQNKLMVVLEGSQEAKKVDFFLRWKRKKFTSLIAGQHSAVTATTGNGALRT